MQWTHSFFLPILFRAVTTWVYGGVFGSPVVLGDYAAVVSTPMDLGTVRRGSYPNVAAWLEDVRIIARNAAAYHDTEETRECKLDWCVVVGSSRCGRCVCVATPSCDGTGMMDEKCD